MAKDVKMADIGAKLGVSTVTVSKALSGQKGVSEAMREKIVALAKEMGYRAPGQSKSAEEKSYQIGVLVASTYFVKYQTFYWEFYQAVLKAAASQNCFTLLEVLEPETEKRLGDLKILKEGKVDGLIILGSVSTAYLKKLEEKSNVPMVFLDFYDKDVTEDCVVSNSFYGTYHMTNYLFKLGHKDIAFVGTVLATDSITDRYLGYTKALLEHDVALRPDWVIPDREDFRTAFEEIKLPKELPTAFVCNCDITASRVIDCLKEAGLSVPKDVSVVGYDDYLYPGLCDVALTTYAVDLHRMAARGIEIVKKKIKGETYEAGYHVVEGHMVIRDSAAPRKEA